jgi:hypothetical protein
MKRSEINSVIREMEELINKVGFACRHSADGHLRSGRAKAMSTMR